MFGVVSRTCCEIGQNFLGIGVMLCVIKLNCVIIGVIFEQYSMTSERNSVVMGHSLVAL